MVDDASPSSAPSAGDDAVARAPAPAPRARRARRLAWILGGSTAALAALALALLVALVWAVHSETGSAWLLHRTPQLTVVGSRGSLIGDFAAERVDIAFPGSGVLRLDAPRWHALAASRGSAGRWLYLQIDTLHADRLTWLPGPAQPAAAVPARAPQSLRLPVEIEIGAASIDELRIGADATPVQEVRGRVHLGSDGGTRHRFDDLAARLDRARMIGSASIGADAPFALTADATLDSTDTELPWRTALGADGPLDAIDVRAQVRAAARTGHAAQALDARAVVRPFAAWPLGELNATTTALDLSAFASAAPATSLSGRADVTTSGLDRPAVVALALANASAGRWNEGRLPVVRLVAELRARPDAPEVIDVQTLTADLGAADRPAGRVVAQGRWARDQWTIDAKLDRVRPALLDARAPETSFDGRATLKGSGFADAPAQAAVDIVAQLAGQLVDRRLPKAAPRGARLRLEARAGWNAIEVRVAEARLGTATASLSGKLGRAGAAAPWQASGRVALVGFDPAPWWPGGADGLFARGANRLDAKGDFDLTLPDAKASSTLLGVLAATRGHATITIADSTLAGVTVAGDASLRNVDGRAEPAFNVVAAGNRASGEGRLAPAGSSADVWRLAIDAPALDRLAPWLRGSAPTAGTALAGTLTAKANLAGRWPELRSDGELHAVGMRYAAFTARRAEGRWQLGSGDAAPLDGTLTLDDVALAGRAIEHAALRLTGTARAHLAELRIDSAALPPEWADALASRSGAAPQQPAASVAATSAATAVARSAPAASAMPTVPPSPAARSSVVAVLEGGLVDAKGVKNAGWRGSARELVAQSTGTPARTWLRARDLRGSVLWAGAATRASVEPGSAEALGATLHWSRIAWEGSASGTGRGHLNAQASIDPLPVAPLLRALQPDFGWGGDLAVGARIDVRSAPTTVVDVVVERARGDLTVTDEVSTQALGFTDLRLGIAARDGVWNFTVGVAGTTLGVASGAVVARTSASAPWPDAATPIEGVLELGVAKLGAWGTWVPPGWRLDGELHASASIGGRFGAPTYTGRIEGSHLVVRNFLQGVNVSDGSVAIALQGNSAKIEHFTAKGGSGTLRLDGDASFDNAPVAHLALSADAFQLLGRVDRRIVASGRAALRLDATTLALDGSFKVDEGLVDFTRTDAPSLSDDVEVVRRPVVAAAPNATPMAATSAASAPAAPQLAPATRKVALDLRVDMGERLRVRGRGLDAGLRGELHLTSPNGRLAVDGTLRAVDGTYQAYGQKLVIDRGVLGFGGAVENPRLDIEATRPDLDVRVGVLVTGTAQAPRVRLFSEPDMSDLDKLSWLVVGRASETVGGADTALLQRAALALLSGEGPGVTDRISKAIGLDEISVRQGAGEVKDTIVSLGKQISKRWYVGYERGLNATTGSWQLVYRIAQRLTVRAEAGGDNAVDLNWTLRWR